MWQRIFAATCFWAGIGFLFVADARGQAVKPAVAELLEDGGEALLAEMKNPGGDPGSGHLEKVAVFSGKSCIKIIPLQRYQPDLPGWMYRITEKPGPGEYRYLRFAWKGEGCAGIMIQFHDDKDWNLRYTAGHNQHGWATLFVADKAPSQWTMVTRDMFKDFGARTLKGMALTVFGGQAGYFDHIYLARTIDDLDRIDATGLSNGKAVAPLAGDLDRHWQELAGEDAAKAYLAFWTLVAAPKQAIPFLEQKLTFKPKTDTKKIKQWITELDDNKFSVRENASKQLAQHVDAAAELLEQALDNGPSAELALRISHLLALRKGAEAEQERIEKAVRILEYAETPEAVQCLTRLAENGSGARVTRAAAAALKRLKKG